MDFFQHQEQARRKTGLLVCYFLIAVAAIVTVAHLAFLFVWHYFFGSVPSVQHWLISPAGITVTIFTLGVMLVGSLHKLWQLRDGGEGLARMLNAQRISPDTDNREQRQLVNVVEEMSLASGIPVPQLFVLTNESAINAFVAGFRPTETVLVVTQGCLSNLNRDELQGVIAHEFSHIFNADMRLNLRLLATLAGILALGKVGEYLLRANSVRHHRPRRNSKNNGGSIAIAGLILMVVGYIGLFFGRLIKSAISRQRELLADASAVQFTREPSGLAGALIKIRNNQGSHLDNLHAEDMSHMCFGETMRFNLNGLLATHPPIDERLNALGTGWVARARARARSQPATAAAAASSAIPEAASGFQAGNSSTAPVADSAPPHNPPERTSQQVGRVQPGDLQQARCLLESIPTRLRQQLQQPAGAEQALYALVASVSRSRPAELFAAIEIADPAATTTLAEVIKDLGAPLRLPLVELALPTLKQHDNNARQQIITRLEALVAADQRQTLFEWALLSLARDHLGSDASNNQRTRFHRYGAVASDIQVLFSVLSWASGNGEDKVQELFNRASQGLLPAGRTLLPMSHCGTERLDRAISRLQALSPLLKGPLLDAGADLAAADGQITVTEAELLRTVASLLDCPLPSSFAVG